MAKFHDLDEWHGCEVKDCNQTASPHEIITRGSGGKREPDNVIWLCDFHHTTGPKAFHAKGRETFMRNFPQFRERIEAACLKYGREAHKGRHCMSEWISVYKKKLPQVGDFLVCLEEESFGCKIEVAHCHPKVTVIGGQFEYNMSPVTHWMPLPEPPK